MGVAIRGVILITVKMTPQKQKIRLQWRWHQRWQNTIKGFRIPYLTILEKELRGCKIAIGATVPLNGYIFIPYLASLIIFFNKKHLIIKMTPHFNTYHWSKNNGQGCQNTI